eukprot:15457132-Alexandrium_andersonii.AAC.1
MPAVAVAIVPWGTPPTVHRALDGMGTSGATTAAEGGGKLVARRVAAAAGAGGQTKGGATCACK